MLGKLNPTKEAITSWPPDKEVFKLLRAMLPSHIKQVEDVEKSYIKDKDAIKAMKADELADLLKEETEDEQAAKEQLQAALLAAMEKEAAKIQQRSEDFKALIKQWHLRPNEADLLYQARLSLNSHYQKQSFIQLLEDSAPLPLKDLYVNLVIVKEEEQKEKDKEKAGASIDDRQALLGTYEYIHQAKEPIAVEDILKPQKTRRSKDKEVIPQRILLTGRAGIGKSTLCKYLAYQWREQACFKDVPWIFHLELKRLVSQLGKKGNNLSLEKLLRNYFWEPAGLTESESQAAWKLLRGHPDKILWILDGYDEVAHLGHPLITQLLEQPRYILITAES